MWIEKKWTKGDTRIVFHNGSIDLWIDDDFYCHLEPDQPLSIESSGEGFGLLQAGEIIATIDSEDRFEEILLLYNDACLFSDRCVVAGDMSWRVLSVIKTATNQCDIETVYDERGDNFRIALRAGLVWAGIDFQESGEFSTKHYADALMKSIKKQALLNVFSEDYLILKGWV